MLVKELTPAQREQSKRRRLSVSMGTSGDFKSYYEDL